MSFEFKHRFSFYNNRFLKPVFENYKLMIVNLKPMFELKTHDRDFQTQVRSSNIGL